MEDTLKNKIDSLKTVIEDQKGQGREGPLCGGAVQLDRFDGHRYDNKPDPRQTVYAGRSRAGSPITVTTCIPLGILRKTIRGFYWTAAT